MDHKTAAKILIGLLDNDSLSQEQKQAINTAIGVLAWTKLAQSRMEKLKNKPNS